MGAQCTKVSEVVPDRDVMIEVVDLVCRFEELLKKGERLTKTQREQKKAVEKVAKEMRKAVHMRIETQGVPMRSYVPMDDDGTRSYASN